MSTDFVNLVTRLQAGDGVLYVEHMENKLKVGDRVRYMDTINEGVITKESVPNGHGWWIAFDTGTWAGNELYSGSSFLKLTNPAPEPLTPLEVARKALSDLTEAGLWFEDLARWIKEDEEAEVVRKLAERRDTLATQFYNAAYGGDETQSYAARNTISQKLIDRIIELEDELASK